MTRRRGKVTSVHPCDDNNQVITVVAPPSDQHYYRREVCAECPWRKDRPVGAFPAEAYRHSARCAYDMAESTFACHMSGQEAPQTCAGFLLSQSADHSLQLRLAAAMGRIDRRKVRETVPTYATYRAMAEANGVDPDDPVLRPCR